MALVKRVESDVMNKVSTNKNPGPPRTTEGGSRPAINTTTNNKTTTTLQRPMSQQNPRSKLPERQLLSRYRHVYAGKGGLFVSRTSFAPPVNFNSSANSQYLDVYRKGLILRISQNIFENSKQTLNKNNVVSNKVSGEQASVSNIESPTSLTLKVSDSQKKIGLKREENVPELISDKDLKAIQQEDPDYNGSPVDNNTNESVNTKGIDINGGIDMRNGGSSEQNNNKTLEHTQQEDYVNTRLNENDNCFITSFKRAHTIIGTIHPRDIQVNGNSVSQTEQNKQSEQHKHEVLLHREKLTNTQNVVKENICEVNTSEVHDICDTESRFNKSKSAKKKQRKDKYALGELELNVLRQRSFVKLPSKMAVVEQRPFSRGALIRSGKRLPTRMSQEALLAINETRKEMGIEVCTEDRRDTLNGNLIQAYSNEDNLHSTDVDIRLQNNSDNDNNNKRDSDVVYSKNFINENKNSPDSVVQQDQSSDRIVHHPSHLLQPSCDSFESTMDSRTSLNGGPKRLSKSCAKKDKFQVFTADEIKQQLKKTNASRKLSSNNKGIKSTEATPISPELGLMPPVGLERKQDSARYSFNLSRDRSPRYGNKRYFSPNTKLSKDNSLSQSNVFLNSPRTKLPHLKLASKSQEDVRLDGVYTSRSRNSSRIKSPKDILEEAEDTLSPLNAKNMHNWKSGGVGHPGLSKEKSFQITPPGWDVRYKDIYGKKGHVDFNDDTPEEVKERAIEKCSDWLLKYM